MTENSEQKNGKNKKVPSEMIEEKIPKYIIGAFSLVAALAWNDAIKDLISSRFGELTGKGVGYKFIYAFIATLFVGIMVIIVYHASNYYGIAKEKLLDCWSSKKAICVMRSNNPMMGGTVSIDELKSGKLLFKINLYGLEPYSVHAFHIHETGDLTDGCDSLGPHYNPCNKTHGFPETNNSHLGDLPELYADEWGKIETTIISNKIKLNDIIGRSLVLHANCDDYGFFGTKQSLTTGNSGARIMCGIIALADNDILCEEKK